MKIVEHFCTHVNLPIKLADVAAHVVQESPLDKLYRAEVDVDLSILKGAYRQYHHKPPYSVGGEIVGEVLYSNQLGPFEARIVQCKEMLHAFDNDEEKASDVDHVIQLTKDIIIPLDMVIKLNGSASAHVTSDTATIFPAIAILLPRDFLDEVRPFYQQGKVSVSSIAKYAHVPTGYVRYALRDEWQEVLDRI